MAVFKVIKAHDGLKAGDTKSLPSGPITDYMVKNGYWKEVIAKKSKPGKR